MVFNFQSRILLKKILYNISNPQKKVCLPWSAVCPFGSLLENFFNKLKILHKTLDKVGKKLETIRQKLLCK